MAGPSSAAAQITGETAMHVLFHFGHAGYPAGDFTQALLDAVCRADSTNIERLRLGFPELVAAVDLAQNHPDGVATLRAIADSSTR